MTSHLVNAQAPGDNGTVLTLIICSSWRLLEVLTSRNLSTTVTFTLQ